MVSIIIPAYNEAQVIAETVGSITRAFEQSGKYKAEIIVVDDCSTDQTALICGQLGIVTLRNPVNVGYGFSIKRGIREASNDTLVIIDADGTYPVDEIIPLLDIYATGFDMVVGARQGSYYEQSFLKKLLRFVLKALVEFTTNARIPDINSGLRVFSKRESLKHLNKLSNAFSFTTSITLVYLLNHKFVKYVAIPYNKRVGKSKVKIVRDIFRTLQYIFEIILYYNPVKIYILLFLITLLQTLLFGAIYLVTANVIVGYIVLSGLLVLPFVVLTSMLAMQFKEYKKQD